MGLIASTSGAIFRVLARPIPVLAVLAWAGLIAAALAPPPVTSVHLLAILGALARVWFYFCSMLLGAAPYLLCGALAATIAARAQASRTGSRSRIHHMLLPVFVLLFPGCDCAMNACAPSLRHTHPGIAAVVLVWGSCCNLLALFATAAILGPRMMWCRILCGSVAATLTAIAWSRLRPLRTKHACEPDAGSAETFARAAASAIASFALAAAISALSLTFFADATRRGDTFVAGIAGALASPCSSADAMLARVLFANPAAQLAFMIAAQCLDVRQVTLVYRSFGFAHACSLVGASAAAVALGCALASR